MFEFRFEISKGRKPTENSKGRIDDWIIIRFLEFEFSEPYTHTHTNKNELNERGKKNVQ